MDFELNNDPMVEFNDPYSISEITFRFMTISLINQTVQLPDTIFMTFLMFDYP